MKNENIFINIYDYANNDFPFQIFIGGRGVGKTYSALLGALKKDYHSGDFIYMRRTQTEIDMILDSDNRGESLLNPFKPINNNLGTNIGFKAFNKKVSGIYKRGRDSEGKPTYEEVIGMGLALSSVAGIRGINCENVDLIIYDEFIPEKHIKAFGTDGAESTALFNAYETINRNRELEGKKPVMMYLLANSNDIYNQIFVGLNIVTICEKMIKNGQTDYYIKSRGLAIHILPNTSAYTEEKSKTALYKLTNGTKFSEMSLSNKFAYNDFSLIGYVDIRKGYEPICSIDDIFIWRKKGEKRLYASLCRHKGKHFNSEHENEVIDFKKKYWWLYKYFVEGTFIFENFDIKTRLLSLLT